MIFDYYIPNVICVEFNYLNLKYKRHLKPLFHLELNEVSHLEVQFNFLSRSITKGDFLCFNSGNTQEQPGMLNCKVLYYKRKQN